MFWMRRKMSKMMDNMDMDKMPMMPMGAGMRNFAGRGHAKFVGGFLLGSVGLAVLASRPARKVYTHAAAAALLARDRIMEGAEKFQAAASDIMADANEIKEGYNQDIKEECIEEIDGEVIE